jgi:transposase-like protein
MNTNVDAGAEELRVNHQSMSQSKEVMSSDPEVLEKPTRRRFTAEYKLHILREAEACTESGCVGALLRREGLYSSHLNTWRRQREEGMLDGLQPKKRGRKASERNPLLPEVEQLRKENERLTQRLKQAELIIDVQKKISQVLEMPMETLKKNEDT